MTAELIGLHLDVAISEAIRARRLIVSERDEKIRAATETIHAEYRERISAASQALCAAQQAKNDYIEASASHPWEGKKVFRVKQKYKNRWSREKIEYREEGLVEVVRKSSEFSDNMRWGRPVLGEVIVRKVKKDGTPSKAFFGERGPIEKNWSLVEDA